MTDTDVRRIEDKVDGLALAMARLEGSLKPTLDKLSERQDDADEVNRDFEIRLRSLERFRYAIPTAAVFSLIVSAAALAYLIVSHHHP